jgi:altronate hydrolase
MQKEIMIATLINRLQKSVQLHPLDNVLVALHNLKAGETIYHNTKKIILKSEVPAKHKFAICDFKVGDHVLMYGVVIGKATQAIGAGEPITTQNLKHDAKGYEVRASNYQWQAPDVSKWKSASFMGYHRSDGQVGTRNFWLVVPLVFCENRNVEYIKNAFAKKLGYAKPDKYEGLVGNLISEFKKNGTVKSSDLLQENGDVTDQRLFKNIDGIKFLSHSGGCGGTREDSDNLCKLIAGYLNNPNVAGATILSLGCQHAQIEILKQSIEITNSSFDKPLVFFEQQKFLSEEALLKQAILETFSMLVNVNNINREPAPLGKLTIGLKCGGSDGFSGITANPAMGHVSDLLAALGGKTILAEFPELCGVEQELIDRTVNSKIANKFATLMTAYNSKAEAIGSGFSMNPSPGNIKDGLITDAMKSAGAAKKGGTSPITDVLNYAEYIHENGLNLLCTPGNDVEATTGMAGSGANLIIFSTGLGTPTGNPVAPVIKTSTNSALTKRLSDLIDFDHGDIITEGKTIEQSGEELLGLIVKIASGEVFTKAEQLQQDDFIPWKRGVSL